MTKLKLSAIPDDRPVKLTIELPGPVHRDLVTYAEIFAQEHGQRVEAAKLVPSMLATFMSTDRELSARGVQRARWAEPGTNKPVSRLPRPRWDAGDVPSLVDVDVTEANSKTLVQKYLGTMRRI